MERSSEVDAYIEGVDEPRRDMLETIRALCAEELDGFDETIQYRMPSYAKDGGPAAVGFANQKQYVVVHVMRADVMDAHRAQLADLDVGKGCIRFARPEQLTAGLDVVRTLLRATATTANVG